MTNDQHQPAGGPDLFDAEQGRTANRDGYDSLMYWPALEAFYGHSGFVNYGYWERGTTSARQACENLLDRLLAWIPDHDGTILDVACGKGATTRHLLRRFPPHRVTGINISSKQIETCRESVPGPTFTCMDAVDLRFADRTFDSMICVEAAFHFNTRRRFFEEARRVLVPGGRLVLSDLLLTREGEANRRFGTVENFVESVEAYARIAGEAGLKVVQLEDATGPCLEGFYWHLVEFGHERLLNREIDVEQLDALTARFFRFVPQFRHYLLACLEA